MSTFTLQTIYPPTINDYKLGLDKNSQINTHRYSDFDPLDGVYTFEIYRKMVKALVYIYAKPFQGFPKPDNFTIVEEELRPLQDGGKLVQLWC